jgi:membrane protease YdiL (CAAX protease family)
MDTIRTEDEVSARRPILSWPRRHPVVAGFVLMFVCTWPIDLWAAAGSHGWVSPPPWVLPVFVGYGFVVAALVMSAIVDGRAGVVRLLRRFLVWRVSVWWYAIVLLGPAVVALAAIGADVMLGGAPPDFDQPLVRRIFGPSLALWVAFPLFFLFDALANGEEIGWRGYAQPRLQARRTALVASLVVGAVWAFWHVPKFLTAGGAQTVPFWLFLVDMLARAIVFAWVLNSTRGSLLTVTLLHAAGNTAAVCLPILPAATGDQRAWTISVGVNCLVAVAVVAIAGPSRLTRSARPAEPQSGA